MRTALLAERGDRNSCAGLDARRDTNRRFQWNRIARDTSCRTAYTPEARIVAKGAKHHDSNDCAREAATAADKNAIRPLHLHVPESQLVELRRRVKATRWPERETVTDASQGVQLATMQELARYWATDYDWRKVEARLNALPQSVTEIDGLDIHFIHVRSKHQNALPMIVTHGWPGSIIEQMKIIDPLTNPTAHGGTHRTLSTS